MKGKPPWVMQALINSSLLLSEAGVTIAWEASWQTPAVPTQPQAHCRGSWLIVMVVRSSTGASTGVGSPIKPRHPMPADLVGLYFNCLRPNLVTARCPNVVMCLRCHREGH
jgi:hypothetical protein